MQLRQGAELVEYLDEFYDQERRGFLTDGKSPAAYEREYWEPRLALVAQEICLWSGAAHRCFFQVCYWGK